MKTSGCVFSPGYLFPHQQRHSVSLSLYRDLTHLYLTLHYWELLDRTGWRKFASPYTDVEVKAQRIHALSQAALKRPGRRNHQLRNSCSDVFPSCTIYKQTHLNALGPYADSTLTWLLPMTNKISLHSITIKVRKWNIDAILLFSPESTFKWYNLFK